MPKHFMKTKSCGCVVKTTSVGTKKENNIVLYLIGGHKHINMCETCKQDELIEIGFTDYLQPTAYLFIEWPQLALNLLEGEKYLTIQIQKNGDNRILNVKNTNNQ